MTQRTVSHTSKHSLIYSVAVLSGAGWKPDHVEEAVRQAEAIFAQCGIVVTAGSVYWVKAPDEFDEMDEPMHGRLLASLPETRPVAVFIDRTTDGDVAYSYLRSAPVASRGTAWITRNSHPACTGVLLAHELGHLLLNSAGHSSEPENLMSHTCRHTNIMRYQHGARLNEGQCERLTANR